VTDATEDEIWVVMRRKREKTYGVALGGGRYRITATALTMPGRVWPGAVVETQVAGDGSRQFVGMVSHSPLRSASTLLDRTAIDSADLEAPKARSIRLPSRDPDLHQIGVAHARDACPGSGFGPQGVHERAVPDPHGDQAQAVIPIGIGSGGDRVPAGAASPVARPESWARGPRHAPRR
jgi:hypothetical protein